MTGKKPCIEWTRKPKIEQYNEVIYDKCLNKEDNKVYMNYRGIPIISVYGPNDFETFDKERLLKDLSIASNEGCDTLNEFVRTIIPELFGE